MSEEKLFGDILTALRMERQKAARGDRDEEEAKKWTQQGVADALEVSRQTYSSWENGRRLPKSSDLRAIAKLFRLSDEDRDALYRAAGQVPPQKHNLPPLNLSFTGRVAYLEQLKEQFSGMTDLGSRQPVCISGLGGIGKTELVLAYAYQSYQKIYRTVLWVNAADNMTLYSSFSEVAHLLELPEQSVAAVKEWLEGHSNWLLIMDNADDLPLVSSYLPVKYQGHILLTTRTQIIGTFGAKIEIDRMEPDEGLAFLLHRSYPSAVPPDTVETREAVREIVNILAGHPLALDQAGAYIEETGRSFAEYLTLYKQRRREVLNLRGTFPNQHPDTVVATFELCFEIVSERHPLAVDILRFCAFLHPDYIIAELFPHDQGFPSDTITLDQGIAVLRRYSLIKRSGQARTFSIHRLVQAVLFDAMPFDLRRQWRKRVVRALSDAFQQIHGQMYGEIPYSPTKEWGEWTVDVFLHMLICSSRPECDEESKRAVDSWLDTAYLKHMAGIFASATQQYPEAEELFQDALVIYTYYRKFYPLAYSVLVDLIGLYVDQDLWEAATLQLERALTVWKEGLGADHPEVGRATYLLGTIYADQGRFEPAEMSYLQALTIWIPYRGTEDTELLIDQTLALRALARLYFTHGKHEYADGFYRRALNLCEQRLGATHFETQQTKRHYAEFLRSTGRDADAFADEVSDEAPL